MYGKIIGWLLKYFQKFLNFLPKCISPSPDNSSDFAPESLETNLRCIHVKAKVLSMLKSMHSIKVFIRQMDTPSILR